MWVAETGGTGMRAATESRMGTPSEEELVDVELIGYPSFDGREIPAWLYRPQTDGRVPSCLDPRRARGAGAALYHPLYQYLLSRGIAVMATNIRGSTGYGKSYQRLVQRDWGGGDMKDWEHAVKWLHEQDWVDADRIGVYAARRRVRRADLRHAPTRILGGRSRHLRPVEPHHGGESGCRRHGGG